MGFLAKRAIPGVDEVRDGVYRRVVAAGEAIGIVTVRPDPGRAALLLGVSPSLASGLADLVERTRRLFDLRADPAEIETVLRSDPLLADRLDRIGPGRDGPAGLRMPGAWDRYEAGVRVILGQQVSVAGATTTAGRLIQQFGECLAVPDGEPLGWRFPPPKSGRSRLAGAGLMPRHGPGRAGLRPRRCRGRVRLETWPAGRTVDFLRTLLELGLDRPPPSPARFRAGCIRRATWDCARRSAGCGGEIERG